MSVYVHMADLFACGFYRAAWPAGVLQAAGHDIKVVRPKDESGLGATMRGDEVVGAVCPSDADTVVLQRPCNRKLAAMVPLLVAKGVRVVVDMDDDLGHINPNNPSFWALHPSKNAENNWAHAAFACRHASLVTVSTAALADVYGSHGRVLVLDNCVPAAALSYPRVDADWVGWAGTLVTHPGDLNDAAGALGRLVGEGHDFRVVGDGVGVARVCGLESVPATGSIPFDHWLGNVGRIGVGVAPLLDTRFNRAKSWLRGLQYSATGVPWVGSDVPEQRRLAEAGGGVVVGRKGWYRELKRLVVSADARMEASEAGRAAAADWTYERRAWRWAEAWQSAPVTVPLSLMSGVPTGPERRG